MAHTPSVNDENDALTQAHRLTLLELASWALEQGVNESRLPSIDISEMGEPLREPRATFVTLHVDGELNGCIGTMEAVRPLALDVVANAYRAGFHDPRFPAISENTLELASAEISILSPLRQVDAKSEDDLLEMVDPGKHGILLEWGERRGTLLPSVWDKVEGPEEFLRHLKFKARVPLDHWPSEMETYLYTVEKFSDGPI